MRLFSCLLVGLLIVLMAVPAACQNRFGFFGGVNIANQGGDMDEIGEMLAQEFEFQFGGTWDSEKSTSPGFGGGITFFIQTSPVFGVQLDGQYIRRGCKIQNAGQDLTITGVPPSLVVTSTFKIDYIEIPLLARYSPSPEATVRPFFLAGPVIGVKTSASIEVEVQGSSQSQDISSGYQDGSFGLIGGIGMDIRTGKTSHLLVQARYYLGLTNPIDDPDAEAKSGDIGFFAGFEFPLAPGTGGAEDPPQK